MSAVEKAPVAMGSPLPHTNTFGKKPHLWHFGMVELYHTPAQCLARSMFPEILWTGTPAIGPPSMCRRESEASDIWRFIGRGVLGHPPRQRGKPPKPAGSCLLALVSARSIRTYMCCPKYMLLNDGNLAALTW